MSPLASYALARAGFSRKTGIALVLSGLVSVSLAACGGADGSEADSSTLTVSIAAGPTNMDFVIQTDPQRDAFGFQNVYQTLTAHRSSDSELVPNLATEWTADGDTWTFKLRDDVTFSNGDEFGADDVVATISTILNDDSGAEQNKGTLATVTGVSEVDETTVEITTSSPDPALPARLTLIGMAPADSTPEERAEELVGTGPYEQVKWNKEDGIVLRARDDYWDEEPKWEEVHVIFRPEASVRLAALEAGEVQVAQDLSPELADAAPAVKSAPQSVVAILRLNARKGPLADPRLREAVNLAIDRELLVDTVFGGFATLPHAQPVTLSAFGANQELKDYPFDPDSARELVEKAGGDVTLTFSGSSGRSLKDRDAGEAVVAMLEAVGFNVEPEFPAVDKWVDQIFAANFGGPDLIYVAHGNEVLDPAFTAGLYFGCDGEVSRFCDDDVDTLISTANSELDVDARQAQYEELWSELKDQNAFAALANLNSVTGTAENLEWEPRQDGFLYFDEMSLG